MEIFAERLKELRKDEKTKISLDKLGKIIGVSDTAIMKWEHNQSEPTAQNIKQLAIHFGVTTDYLLGLADEPTPTSYKNYINNSFNNSTFNGGIKF